MKIEYAIHSVDDNPLYADFWPLVSKVWKVRFGIEPLLLVVKDKFTFNVKDYDTTYGKVVNIHPVSKYETYLQCLWVRYWYPCQLPESVSIISDIDMFPISKHYFIEQIANIDSEKYVHLYPISESYYPTCYHVAKGKTFKKVLKLPETLEASLKELCNSKSFHGTHMGFAKWGIDESFATTRILEYDRKQDIQMVSRRGGDDRIDRSNWSYRPDLVNKDYYADSHSLRPYEEHKKEIDELVNLLTLREEEISK